MKVTVVDKKLAIMCNSIFPYDVEAADLRTKINSLFKYNLSPEITDEAMKEHRVPQSCAENYDVTSEKYAPQDGLSGALLIRW